MNHYLPRFTAFQWICIVLLAAMCAPLGIAAAHSLPAVTSTSGGTWGTVLSLASLGMMLRSEEKDGEGGGGADGSGPGTASEDDPKASLLDRFKAATSSKAAIQAKLSAAEARETAAEAKANGLESKLTAMTARATSAEAKVTEIEQALAASEKETADLAAKDKDIDTRASEQAKTIVSGVGIDPKTLPAAGGDSGTGTYAQHMEKYAKLTDAGERARYWSAHIEPLLK